MATLRDDRAGTVDPNVKQTRESPVRPLDDGARADGGFTGK